MLDHARQRIWEIVNHLSHQRYDAALHECAKSRLSTADIKRAIEEYGHKLAVPPRDAYEDVDAVEVLNRAQRTLSVRVPMWTSDEGRSDLTLELTVTLENGRLIVEFDDLHVL